MWGIIPDYWFRTTLCCSHGLSKWLIILINRSFIISSPVWGWSFFMLIWFPGGVFQHPVVSHDIFLEIFHSSISHNIASTVNTISFLLTAWQLRSTSAFAQSSWGHFGIFVICCILFAPAMFISAWSPWHGTGIFMILSWSVYDFKIIFFRLK